MEKQEKKTKVSGVYLVLAALTVLFAVSLVFLHKTAYEGASHGNYTVTTQDKTDEITAPFFGLVYVALMLSFLYQTRRSRRRSSTTAQSAAILRRRRTF